MANVRSVPQVAFEQLVLDLLAVGSSHAETDHACDLLHDVGNARADSTGWHVEPKRHVSTCDIEANAADRNVVRVPDIAADGGSISQITISTQQACDSITE